MCFCLYAVTWIRFFFVMDMGPRLDDGVQIILKRSMIEVNLWSASRKIGQNIERGLSNLEDVAVAFGCRQVVEVQAGEEATSEPQCGEAAFCATYSTISAWSSHWSAHQLHVRHLFCFLISASSLAFLDK